MLELCFKGYTAHEHDGEITYEQREWLYPRAVRDAEVEGTMYDVACMVLDESEGHDWITVVAFDAYDLRPLVVVDFGRRYDRYTADEFGRVWSPSRDYRYGTEIGNEF